VSKNDSPAASSANSSTTGDFFWNEITSIPTSANEAEVERIIVLPLLAALGYSRDDIAAKVPVTLTQGTKLGRPFEADFVAYSGSLHDRDTSLMVVEAKAPGKSLDDARKQGESYAIALRAPALLLTDGQELQVWQLQPTLENKQVFICPLSVLRAQRGTLESLIGKRALVAYASELTHKKLTPATDFGAYESSELTRTQAADRAIARLLLSETGEQIASDALLERYPQGAVISAPSGYGKTTMAAQLLRQGIKRRWGQKNSALPGDIPLVDLDTGKQSLLDFVQARVVAHHPQVTVSTIQDVARSRGLLLVCDGYERIEPAARPALESHLRQLARDFPKSQLFVFSRGSVAPQLAVPRIQLQPLSLTERQAMAALLAGGNCISLSQMPRLLVEISEIPLILERIIFFWKASRRFPVRLEELFEHWMQQLLGVPSAAPAVQAIQSKVLSAFAQKLGSRSLTLAEALDLTIARGGDPKTFDTLVQCGALLVSTTSVDFVHEGLADHIRARALAELPEVELSATLSSMSIDEDSLLPVLLAALVKDAACRTHVWKRLRDMSLPRYIDAIRFSAHIDEPLITENLPTTAGRFVEDMAASVEALVDGFFPSIAAELRGSLADQLTPSEGLCLIANIAAEPNMSLVYSLQPAANNTVKIACPSSEMSRRFVSLSASQLGAHDGRYMGAIAVRDALFNLVRHRRFRGGTILANERTIGRLRFMEKEYDFTVDPQESLSDLLLRLNSCSHMAVVPSPSRGAASAFTIANMIGDLELLQAQGYGRLDWWWLQYGTRDEIVADQQRAEGFLREHYKRTVELYSEIVSTSFAKVSGEFSLYQVIPVQWQLAIVSCRQLSSPMLHWRWLPVATVAEAVVDVSFCDTTPDDFIHHQVHDSRLIEEMGRLGRNTDHYTIGGSRAFPNMDIWDWRGVMTGETSVMRDAIKYLEDDVKYLFSDLPNHGPMLAHIPMHL